MKYVQPVGAAVNAAYVDANPVGGVEGSPVPAAALEHPQREIENVITAAGLVPSSGDLTQLAKAILKLALAINGSGAMTGALKAKSGAMGPANPNNCGYVFGGDGDTGVFSSSDGVLELGVDGQLVFKAIGVQRTFYFGPGNTWRFELQGDGNVVLYNALGVVIFESNALATAGLVAFFARNSAPIGYLKANGAAISRATYATLFAAIGTTFGVGDGSTTFNVPDLRGEFPRGWDDARGIDAGRGFGSFQKGTFHNIGSGPVVDCVSDYSVSNGGAAAAADLGLDTGVPSDYPNARYGSAGTAGPMGAPMYTDASYGVTRPRNIALLACIKY